MNHVYISENPFECRLAFCQDGTLSRYRELRRGRLAAGAIAVGRVTKVLPGIQSAFVEIGSDQVFIRLDRTERHIKEGQTHVVTIHRESEPDKHAMGSFVAKARGLFAVIQRGQGLQLSRGLRDVSWQPASEITDWAKSLGVHLLLRSAAQWCEPRRLQAELVELEQQLSVLEEASQRSGQPRQLDSGWTGNLLDFLSACSRTEPVPVTIDDEQRYDWLRSYAQRFAPQLGLRLRRHQLATPLFHAAKLTSQLTTLDQAKVWLKSGGFIRLRSGDGLTTIDVNSGKGSSNKQSKGLKHNLEAACEAARQIQLRNLGGLIVVDFIDMRSSDDRIKLAKAFQEGFADDNRRSRFEPVNQFGVMMMTREKNSPSLSDLGSIICSSCKGSGTTPTLESQCQHLARELWQDLQSTDEPPTAFNLFLNEPLYRYLNAHQEFWLDPIRARFNIQFTLIETANPKHAYEFQSAGDEI